MSIWDRDAEAQGSHVKKVKDLGAYEKLDSRGPYTLYRHITDDYCIIIDNYNNCIASGDEGPMRAKLRELVPVPGDNHPKYGDVIGVHRSAIGVKAAYDHYGVYENDECVYEYAAETGDFFGSITIHKTTLKKFIGNSSDYFVLTFPEKYGKPGKVPIATGVITYIWNEFFNNFHGSYHLYSAKETIDRAKSRLCEKQYHFFLNNCEHFAIWCKTGMSESHQINAFLKRVGDTNYIIKVLLA